MMWCCSEAEEIDCLVVVKTEKTAPETPAVQCLHVHDTVGHAWMCLTFTVISARGFRNFGWLPGLGKPDCYVVVSSNNQAVCKTKVVVDSMEPRWDEEFEYQRWREGDGLEFHLYDKDLVGFDYHGKATIEHDSFRDGFNGDLQLQGGTHQKPRAFIHVKIKPPGKVYPPYPPGLLEEYEVTLRKGRAKIGLNVDTQDTKTLFITGISEGAAAEHNREAKPENQLVKGDFIIEANGVAGNAKSMLDRFVADNTIVARVRRALDVTLILERNQVPAKDGTEGDLQPLGITWPVPLHGAALVVLEINDGLFKDWNDSQTDEDPASKVRIGDRITRVGTISGSALILAKAIQEASGKFQLALVRAQQLESNL